MTIFEILKAANTGKQALKENRRIKLAEINEIMFCGDGQKQIETAFYLGAQRGIDQNEKERIRK